MADFEMMVRNLGLTGENQLMAHGLQHNNGRWALHPTLIFDIPLHSTCLLIIVAAIEASLPQCFNDS
nr:hypothetical protein Iba_chr11bCG4780 [Ipomoea batatas]